MSYYFAAKLAMPLDAAVEHVTDALQKEGFGVLTEIDVRATLKKKLEVDFRPYVILGACNPPLAHKALQSEENIGLMLPCNVILQQKDDATEVAAIDPIASMAAIDNPGLGDVAALVQAKLKNVVENLVPVQ